MIKTLTRIYRETKNKSILIAAVRKGWITDSQMQEIMET